MASTIQDVINSVSTSVAVKAPCKVATTANITLSGQQTIDGVAVVTGDRVLVRSQTDSVDNGIWEVSTSSWTRTDDFDGNRDVVKGTIIIVNSGTVNGNKAFSVVTSDPIVIGTTAITFQQTPSIGGDAASVDYGSSTVEIALDAHRVDSISALVTGTWTGISELQTLGFYANTYRGGAKFHTDGTTGGTPTADNTTAIIAAMRAGQVISADGKGWVLDVGDGRINAESFGLLAGNTGNQAPAMQAFIYWQRYINGTTTDVATLRDVIVPPGIYRCTSPIYVPSNTRVIGSGGEFPQFNFIGCNGFAGSNNATGGDASQPGYSGTGVQNVTIENLIINGDNTASTVGIYFDECFFCTFGKSNVQDFPRSVQIRAQMSVVNEVRALDFTTEGFYIGGQSVQMTNCNAESGTYATKGFYIVGLGHVLSSPHVEGVQYAFQTSSAYSIAIIGARVTVDPANAATAIAVDMLTNSAVTVIGLTTYGMDQTIECDDAPLMDVYQETFVPFWTYGQSNVTGSWTPKFNNMDLVGASAAILTFTSSSAQMGRIFASNATGALNIEGNNAGIIIDPEAGSYLRISNLPTSNPGGTGRVWSNGGVLSIT